MASISIFHNNGKLTISADNMVYSGNIIKCGQNIIVLHTPVSDRLRNAVIQFSEECKDCDIYNLISRLLHKFGPDNETEGILTVIGCIGKFVYVTQFNIKKNNMKILYCGNMPSVISV